MLLSNTKLTNHIRQKYQHNFTGTTQDNDFKSLFTEISQYIDISVYVELLAFIDMMDYENFQRFICVCLRRYMDANIHEFCIEDIKGNPEMQLVCIICMQYYFL
jgi:hypothetical protein